MTEYGYTDRTGVTLKTEFGFRTIWVIESLPEGEYRTGKELREDVLYYLQIKDPGLYVEFVEVEGRTDLFVALATVKSTIERTGQVPLLHLETHGAVEGLSLKSGEFVRYDDLFLPLREMNILVQNNLFVVVAACSGAHLIQIINPSARSPVWGFCGPSKEVTAQDIFRGYKAFYKEAVTTGDMNRALSQLKAAIPHCADLFHIWNSEYLFLHAFRRYLTDWCSPQAIDRRTDAIIAKSKADLGDAPNWREYERNIRTRLGTEEGQRREFDRLKRHFFFHDLYPRVDALPNPSFEMAMELRVNDGEGRQ